MIRIFDASTGELLASASGHEWADRRRSTGRSTTAGSPREAVDGTARVWRFDGSTLLEDLRLSADDLAAGVAGRFVLAGRRPPRRERPVDGRRPRSSTSPNSGRRAVQPRDRAVHRRGDHGRPGRHRRQGRVRPDDRSVDRQRAPAPGRPSRWAASDASQRSTRPEHGSRCSPSTSRHRTGAATRWRSVISPTVVSAPGSTSPTAT